MRIEQYVQFLQFKDLKEELLRDKKDFKEELTVFKRCRREGEDYSEEITVSCGLLPNDKHIIKQVLSHFDWDINLDYGYPSFCLKFGKIHYERYNGYREDLPFEPLVIYRTFHGCREDYVELSEEFRLYHRLYHDIRRNELIRISKSGDEDIVARIEKTNNCICVKVKIGYLRDFLSAKSMVLVRFHEHYRYLNIDLTNVLGQEPIEVKEIKPHCCFNVVVYPKEDSPSPYIKSFSMFLGKDIVFPLDEPIHEDYKRLKGDCEEKYVKFIIDVDEYGNPIEHTCNPKKLSDSEYLTPVFFRREVLKKYYDNPSKYKIGDGYIRCCNLWIIRYGQNELGLVHAWLGDLGEYLPYNEQLHWRQYNIPPEGGISKITIKRELFAEPAEPEDETNKFKYEFHKFQEHWKSKFGWFLFEPLNDDDKHYFVSLHTPTTEEQLEFEHQILALAKILPDSINVSKIKEFIGLSEENVKRLLNVPESNDIGKIHWLTAMLIYKFKIDEMKAKEIVRPLKIIQDIRSSATAHRKGDRFERIKRKLELPGKSYSDYFRELLRDIIEMFQKLEGL